MFAQTEEPVEIILYTHVRFMTREKRVNYVNEHNALRTDGRKVHRVTRMYLKTDSREIASRPWHYRSNLTYGYYTHGY